MSGTAIRLRDVGGTYGGLTGKTKDDFGTGFGLYVTFLEVINSTRLVGRTLGRVRVGRAERQNRVQRGDVLFNGSSETPEEVALSAVVDFDPALQTFLNSFCFGYRVQRRDLIEPAYLAYFFRSATGRELISPLAQGATRYNIAKTKFLDLVLDLPDLNRQRDIANMFQDADEGIEAIERLISKRQAIKQGMMQQLLTGKTRLPGFTDEWITRKIGDFAQVKAGGTPSTAVPRYWGGDVRWMNSGEIHAKRVSEVEGRITADGLRESAAQLLPAGTILIALAGQGKTRGTVALSRIELSTNQSIAGILPSREHDPDYLYYNLDARYEELRGESSGDGGRGGLNLTILKSLEVFMPPRGEQRAIANILGDTDDGIDLLKHRLAKARDVKQGMMQDLLAGCTCLPVQEAAV
jgi:type I restriction enzyme S subunit